MDRRGLTLIELLVSASIIAVLFALSVPAVHKVRAAAARLSCQNNLKQIGLAAQNHHAVRQHLPTGVTPPGAPDSLGYSTWLARLLPYLDHDAVWIETLAAYRSEPTYPLGGQHVGLKTVIKTYICPLDDRLVRPHSTELGFYVALTSYQGLNGSAYPAADGVYYYQSATRLTDISDGTSNTLAAGERPPPAGYNYGWWYAAPYASLHGGTVILGANEVRAPNDFNTPLCGPGPHHFQLGMLTEPCDALRFWSLHPGGANFAFCDGSVRFLAYSADAVLPALATRAGGEVVEVP